MVPLRRPSCVLLLFVLLLFGNDAAAQTARFTRLGAEVIEARLKTASQDNTKRREQLQALFQAAGCAEGQLAAQAVAGSKQPNVICTLPGETQSIILVGAHHDTAFGSPGAADNWSGACLLPSLFESLRNVPRKHTFVFVGFTEEKGLRGSAFYVKTLKAEKAPLPRAMINLDVLGLSFTKVWLSEADPRLVAMLGDIAASLRAPLQAVNVERVGRSDSEAFKKAGVPVLSIHSLEQKHLRLLHTRDDELSNIQASDYYQTYHLLAAYLAYLDKALP